MSTLTEVSAMQYKQKLTQIGLDILIPGDFHDQLAPAVMGYSDMLFQLSGVNDIDEQRADIYTEHGKAIGTFWAAHCVRQVIRTQRFCRGLYHAINDVLKTKPGRPVHVVYAGTGPFATLALPIMLQFKPDELQFTMLEINPESFDKLKQLLNLFKLEDYVKSVELCDAISWQATDKEVDIVLSETMNSALQIEPQINIMLNMVSQLPPEVICIPQEITVGVAYNIWQRQEITGNTDLYSFNKTTYQQIIKQSADKSAWVYDKTTFNYSPMAEHRLVYTTAIKVYGEDELHYPDCTLNDRKKVDIKSPEQTAVIEFQYQDGVIPGFKAEVV